MHPSVFEKNARRVIWRERFGSDEGFDTADEGLAIIYGNASNAARANCISAPGMSVDMAVIDRAHQAGLEAVREEIERVALAAGA